MVHGMLLTGEWRRIQISEVPTVPIEVRAGTITVPVCRWPDVSAARMGLLEREAAYALAVRFMVDSGHDHYGFTAGRAHLCVEARLVEVKLSYSYNVEEVGVCEPFSLGESLRYLKSKPRELPRSVDAVVTGSP